MNVNINKEKQCFRSEVITFYNSRLAKDGTMELVPKELFKEEVNSAEEVVQFAKKVLDVEFLSEESMFCFCFNTRMHCNAFFLVASGTASSAVVDIRGLLTKALLLNATNVIFLHNHPSGSCLPSKTDIKVTEQLSQILNLAGICLIDHIIVSSFIGEGKYYSFKNRM